MTTQIGTAPPQKPKREETLTPFIERSITELINLFVQLFTTPFAVLRYNKQFRDQISALADDDIETAYPEAIARPLSFFVLLMGAHCLIPGFMAGQMGSRLFGSGEAKAIYKSLVEQTGGSAQAIIIISFALTLIIATKSFFVSMSGRLLRCPVRFRTTLHASAYAFGTFIFFLYVFIAIKYLGSALGKPGTWFGSAVIAYGSLILSMLLVVRVNQVIRQVDGTAELATYTSWLIGTIVWQFFVVLCAMYILDMGGIADYWGIYFSFWKTFAGIFIPST